MKKCLCLLLMLLLITASLPLIAQDRPIPVTSFSHLYFVIDSVAYQALLKDTFCNNQLFYSKINSSTMDQGSWNGNYLRGEYDYWEVFNPGSLDHAKTGTIGLGEMLHKPQELFTLRQRWQMLTRDSIITLAFTKKNGADTSIVELMNYRDSMLSGGMACFFVLHYHPSILLKSGFTKEYISDTGVSQVGLNKKGLGKGSYDRLYKKIEKIYLTLTAHEFERHQIALQAMGYTRTGKRKFKKEIEVIIDINEKATSRLNKIEFSLTRATAKRTIILSPKVYVEVQGNMGRLVAN